MRRRLILGFVSVSIVLVIALAVPLGVLFTHYVREQAVDHLEDRATGTAVAYEQAADAGESFTARGSGERSVSVVDRRGRLVTGAELPEGAARLATATIERGDRSGAVRTGGRLLVAVIAGTPPEVVGAVVMSEATSDTDRSVATGWLLLSLLSVIVVGFAGLVATRLAAWIERPLDELRRTSEAFGGADLDARVEETHWPPDLQRLGATFNRMASRIEELVAQNESFVHEASHQLRTPLTALRLRLENLAADSAVPDSIITELGAATDEVNRLSRLTDGLLAVARAERRATDHGAALEIEPFLATRVGQWQALADEYGIELVHLPSSPSRVHASLDRLDQVVDNLIANALEASPAGTKITCQAVPDKGSIAIHIADQGRGMSEEERTRAFDRFWSNGSDPHRNGSGAGLGGSGLGLPIAARLLTHDGGSIRLAAGPGGRGTDAVVTLRRV